MPRRITAVVRQNDCSRNSFFFVSLNQLFGKLLNFWVGIWRVHPNRAVPFLIQAIGFDTVELLRLDCLLRESV